MAAAGEKVRIALAELLLLEPTILLMDEPTNHLDAESVQWLEQHLQQYKGTVIAVTHDRYFLDNVAGWILELDRGYGIPYKGNYSSWLEQKQERIRLEEKAESKRQQTLQRELEWIRMSPKARQSKGQARVSAYEKLLNQEAEARREELEGSRRGPRQDQGARVRHRRYPERAAGEEDITADPRQNISGMTRLRRDQMADMLVVASKVKKVIKEAGVKAE